MVHLLSVDDLLSVGVCCWNLLLDSVVELWWCDAEGEPGGEGRTDVQRQDGQRL